MSQSYGRSTLNISFFTYPDGSKDPNNRVLGPKYHLYFGLWVLKPYYLGPWTLRVIAVYCHRELLNPGFTYVWLAGNEGMGKKMETTIMGHTGTIIRGVK